MAATMDVDHHQKCDNWVICSYCSRCYPNMERFNEHHHLHDSPRVESESDEEIPDNICTICKISYSSDLGLKRHRRRAHGILTRPKQKARVASRSRPPIICPICKQSVSGSNLRRHQRGVNCIKKPLEMTSKVSKKTRAHPRKDTKPTKAKGTPKKGRVAPRKPNTPAKVKVDEEGTPKRGRGGPRNPNKPIKAKVDGRGCPRKVPIPPEAPKQLDNVEVKLKKTKNVKKKKKTEVRRLYCSICQKVISNEYALQRHNRIFHYLDGKKVVYSTY